MKAFLKISGFVVLAILLVIVTRTLLHTPNNLVEVNRVDIALDKHLAAQHLSEAIQFQTVSHQIAEHRDQQAFENFINWVATTYPLLHQSLSLQRLNDTLLYKWEGSDPSLAPILVTGHYDVVPVIPGTESNWHQPPFSGKIVDGVIWGRGALDDKSGVIGILESASYLLNEGYRPKRSIYLSLGHDEETGGENGAALVAATLKTEGVQLAWSLDEGSFVLDDMLPGVSQLVAAINVAEKGSVTLEIAANSTGGHSSMPPQKTAVGILAEAIVKLQQNPVPGGLEGLSLEMFDTISLYMPFIPRALFANRWLFGGILDRQMSKLPMTNAVLRTTTAPTMLSASIKTNVLPIEAVAVVNFRIHPRDSVEDVVNYVKGVVENDDVKVRTPGNQGQEASNVSDWNSEGFSIIGQSLQQAYGELVVTPGLMIAASDSRHYGTVADDAFRFNPFIVTSADLTGLHGTNEKISVDNLAAGIRAYTQIIKNGTSR